MVSFQSTVPALLIVRKLPLVQAQNVQVPIYSQSCTKTCRCCSAHPQVWLLEKENKNRSNSPPPPPPFFFKNFPRNNNKKKQQGSPMTSLSAAPDSLCAALSPAGPHSSASRQRQAIQRPLNHDWSGNPFRNQWD